MFKINSTHTIILLIILIVIAFLLNRYSEKEKRERKPYENQYSAIQKYLLNENTTDKDLEK